MMPRHGDAPHHRLIVWRKALDLVRTTYQVARVLPPEERFELARQLRRASGSVVANIAEGAGRRHRRDYARFLAQARGSVREVAAQLTIAAVCDLAPPEVLAEPAKLADEISRMLTAMLKRIDPL
jgi:four helix bundle protein